MRFLSYAGELIVRQNASEGLPGDAQGAQTDGTAISYGASNFKPGFTLACQTGVPASRIQNNLSLNFLLNKR